MYQLANDVIKRCNDNMNHYENKVISEMNELLKNDEIDSDMKSYIIKNNISKLNGFYTLKKNYFGNKICYLLERIN